MDLWLSLKVQKKRHFCCVGKFWRSKDCAAIETHRIKYFQGYRMYWESVWETWIFQQGFKGSQKISFIILRVLKQNLEPFCSCISFTSPTIGYTSRIFVLGPLNGSQAYFPFSIVWLNYLFNLKSFSHHLITFGSIYSPTFFPWKSSLC